MPGFMSDVKCSHKHHPCEGCASEGDWCLKCPCTRSPCKETEGLFLCISKESNLEPHWFCKQHREGQSDTEFLDGIGNNVQEGYNKPGHLCTKHNTQMVSKDPASKDHTVKMLGGWCTCIQEAGAKGVYEGMCHNCAHAKYVDHINRIVYTLQNPPVTCKLCSEKIDPDAVKDGSNGAVVTWCGACCKPFHIEQS